MITREMITDSTDTEWLFINEPELLAQKLFPDEPRWAEHAALKIYGDLESVFYGTEELPDSLWFDQIEDWFAARALRQVTVTQHGNELLASADRKLKEMAGTPHPHAAEAYATAEYLRLDGPIEYEADTGMLTLTSGTEQLTGSPSEVLLDARFYVPSIYSEAQRLNLAFELGFLLGKEEIRSQDG